MKVQDRWIGRDDPQWDGVLLRPSPFGSVDGLQNYRGLVFPEASRLVGKRFVGVDLAQAGLSLLWLEGCSFEGCSFEKADFRATAEHGNTFSHCVFSRTNFGRSHLGYRGSRYQNCRFDRCNFSGGAFIRAELDDCEFLDCKLYMMDFRASSFVRCTFKGRLASVWFRGGYGHPELEKKFGKARPNRMEDVSFEEAELVDVMFYNQCPLDGVKLPREGDYLLVTDFQKRLSHLEEIALHLEGDAEQRLRFFLKIMRIHQDQRDGLLNLEEVAKNYGADVAEIVRDNLG
jgi:uncharacterized protein YjbI with pentapeptide repeats